VQSQHYIAEITDSLSGEIMNSGTEAQDGGNTGKMRRDEDVVFFGHSVLA
jgi:hypothetical protein